MDEKKLIEIKRTLRRLPTCPKSQGHVETIKLSGLSEQPFDLMSLGYVATLKPSDFDPNPTSAIALAVRQLTLKSFYFCAMASEIGGGVHWSVTVILSFDCCDIMIRCVPISEKGPFLALYIKYDSRHPVQRDFLTAFFLGPSDPKDRDLVPLAERTKKKAVGRPVRLGLLLFL